MASTQVAHPTRATVRTLLAALVAFAGIFPSIVDAAHLPQWAGVTIAVAVAGGITRVLALPQVEAFLQVFGGGLLSASPAEAPTDEPDDPAADVAVPDVVTPSGTDTPDTVVAPVTIDASALTTSALAGPGTVNVATSAVAVNPVNTVAPVAAPTEQ